MLKRLRQILAVISIVMVTLLFVDFTGMAARWFSWMAKIQFLPAVLSLNVGVILLLVVMTLVLGRVYCSVICPLGIMQDGFGWIGKKVRRYRYSWSPAKRILRYAMLVVMIVLLLAGLSYIASLIAPYSAYGRIAHSLLGPVWDAANNLLASWSESAENYYFYRVGTPAIQWVPFSVAVVTLVVLGFLAYRNGRTYCNTICPVGTVLGFLSRYSWLKPVIDTSKCNSCGLCARNCKSSCINSKEHSIDYSRCVVCLDCISTCQHGAISYRHQPRKSSSATEKESVDNSRRTFVITGLATAGAAAVKAAEKTVDGGLAVIEDKKEPQRHTKIVPPGALSIRNLESHCTACQLCISACPNGVLRPSGDPESLMQPYSSYENGYCRPECTRCSNVCPVGAIRPISREDKSSIQIGHAVWVKENCIPLTDGVECGNCARHCPVGAITMIPSVPGDTESRKIPAVNTEKCIGCGACENLCPARPFSAIYVEGHENHKTI